MGRRLCAYVIDDLWYIYIGHTSPAQIERYCHLHVNATGSTNKPVTPLVTTIPTVTTWPAVIHLGKSGDRSVDKKPLLFQLLLNVRPVDRRNSIPTSTSHIHTSTTGQLTSEYSNIAPRSTVIEKLTGSQLVNKLPPFYEN